MALTPATMAEGLWIGSAGGQNHYNVGIGQGTSGGQNHTDFSQALIEAGYEDPDKFFLNSDENPVFRINAGAGRTSTNTAHPRSELREFYQNGTDKAAWDGRTGQHYMRGRSRIIDVTSNRPWVCFFQIHGTEGISPEPSDLFRIQCEGTTGQTTNLDIICRRSPPSGGEEIVTTLMTGYDVNDWIDWEILVGGPTSADNGRTRISLNGLVVLDVTGMAQAGCYFKMGCYLQDNVEKGASASDYAAVEVLKGSFQTWHTGTPPPTVPVFTGPDDGLGSATDTQAPTVPGDVAAIRGDTQAIIVWDASTDNVGVDHYVVRRTGGGGGTALATLGKTDDGPSQSLSSAAKTIVCSYTADQAGTLVSGHGRLWVDTGTAANVTMAVYADTAGVPTTRLAVSDTVSVTATAEAVKDFTFSGGNQISIVAGTVYWIGYAWPDPGSNSITWSRNATTSQTQQATSNAPSPFGTPSTVLSGPIDAYVDVEYSSDATTTAGSPTTTTLTDTGLTNGVEYSYTVSAVDAASNESVQSDPVTVTPGPPDITAPSVPDNLAAVPGDREVRLTWDASTDADTGVREYHAYRDAVLIGETTDTSFTFTELTNGTQYSLTVSAVDESLNESAQSAAELATPEAPAIGGVSWLPAELGAGASLAVEVAFGADLASSPDDWTWTDITAHARQEPGISTSMGRNDESGTSNPAELTLLLTNTSGDYSLGGRSQHWPYIRRGAPVRVRIDPDDGAGGRVLFHGEANGWTPGWDTTGNIPVVTLSASGTLRRLAQGSAPVVSAYRRFATASPAVVAYWPMEDGTASAYGQPVRGGSIMKVEGGTPDWAADSTFFCSDKLVKPKNARLNAYSVYPYPDTGAAQVRFLLLLPDSPTAVPTGAYICSVFTTGSIARWDIIYDGGNLRLSRFLTSGAQQGTDSINFGSLNGVPTRISLELSQSGGNIAWSISTVAALLGASSLTFSGTITSHTVGAVSVLQFGANQQLGDTAVGHLTLENAISSAFAATDVLTAFQGEVPTGRPSTPFLSRIERLCSENGIAVTRYPGTLTGDALTYDGGIFYGFDSMGPQLVAPLLTLLGECESADQGQLWDGRSFGLSYTTRRRREMGTVKLTIDAAAGELTDGFEPTDDDQRTRNLVEVKRTHGTAAAWEDETGPLGTATIGRYDESVTVNNGRDQDVVQHAQWRVSHGTEQGYRYPSVTVDLRKSPNLAGAVLDLVPGERIDVTNLDDTLDAFTAPSVSLIVEGIAHEITQMSWRVTFRCSPFDPWAVGRVAAETGDTSDMLMRLDTDGSTLNAGASAAATSIVVASSGTPWTTLADDYPLWLEVGGLPVRATACSGSSSPQTFTVDALPIARTSGMQVQLWRPRRLGMGDGRVIT